MAAPEVCTKRTRARLGLLVGLMALLPLLAWAGSSAGAQPGATAFPAPTAGEDPVAVPTFHCLGLYWAPTGGAEDNECTVRYRAVGREQWGEALPLWFDARNREYRGSIVSLQPGTDYEVSLQIAGNTRTLQAHTWSEQFPVAQQVGVPEHSAQTLVVEQSGSPKGYVLYAPAEGKGATIDVDGRADECVQVKGSYVILRGLRLEGPGINAIAIAEGCHDIVIEHCDISGWGRVDADGWGHDYDAAVYARGAGVTRVTIQRNRIHHPRADSNSWKEERLTRRGSDPHPMGPQAVTFFDTGGNHVIRYNDVYSDDEHRYNDCLGGGENFSYEGSPNRDSDIYGNRLSDCWDDAIESEGANCNVRIWGNYITNTFVKIAIGSVSVGPIYIWRNIAGTARYSPFGTTDDDDHGPFIKAGSRNHYNGGRIYVFHNTLLQPPPPPGVHDSLGCSTGPSDYAGTVLNMVSRNNIWHVSSARGFSIGSDTTDPSNSFDYDLYNGRIRGPEGSEAHGIQGTPRYDPKSERRPFRWLAADSPGYDAGVRLPNFNDSYVGKGPDMGAYEAGAAPMQFGVGASRTQ
jgi:hypothetical protein